LAKLPDIPGFVTLYHGLCRHKNTITIKYLHTSRVTKRPQLLSIYDHMRAPAYIDFGIKLNGEHMKMHREIKKFNKLEVYQIN